jgi:hypothetical protein
VSRSSDSTDQAVGAASLAVATSPTTGQRYAGKWTVEIPSLKTRLTVNATPTLQEIQARAPFSPGINEAASTVTGAYQGKRTTGQAYVEQFGIWK